MYSNLLDFRKRFGLGCPRVPQLLSDEALTFRLKLLHEELQEFEDANAAKDLPEAADALVDLVYVAIGCAVEMGLPWEELWADVHRANMEKVRAAKATDSKRGSTFDVVKPPGWRPPNGAKIIARALEAAQRADGASKEQLGLLEEQHARQVGQGAPV